ncbi:MAG: DUF1573 domain-containing protein [Planctomycetia bacterium]
MQKLWIGLALLGGVIIGVVLLSQPKEKTIADSLKEMKTEQRVMVPGKKRADLSDLPVPSETGPWPAIVVDEPVFAFGRMAVRSTNSHTFVIKNQGEADLILKAGETTCKCTTFGFGTDKDNAEKKAVVKPGESVSLLMNWKAGEAPDRAFRHGGDIHTNDPKDPVMKVVVEGAIENLFEVLPQYTWDLGSMYEEPGYFKAGIGSKMYEDFTIQSIESPSGMVKVEVMPMSAEELAIERFVSGYSLRAEVSSKIASGVFSEDIVIRTTASPEPLKVTVKAKKFGAIRLQQMAGTILDPNTLTLMLGSFKAAEGNEANLLLIVDEKEMSEPFAITATEADPAFLAASLSPVGAPSGTVHRYLLTLRIPPGRAPVQRTANNPGFVRLSTNHPSGDAVSLGVYLYSN